MNNEDRAGYAHEAAMAFAHLTGQAHGGVLDNADMAEVLGDLLCNLHHLADVEELDWERLVERGEMHHSAEVDEEAVE